MKWLIFLVLVLISKNSFALECKKVQFDNKNYVYCDETKKLYISDKLNRKNNRVGESSYGDEFLCKKVFFEGAERVFCPGKGALFQPYYGDFAYKLDAQVNDAIRDPTNKRWKIKDNEQGTSPARFRASQR